MTITKDMSQTLQKLDALSETLQSDLSSVDHDDALKMIEKWYTYVRETKKSESKMVANGFNESSLNVNI